MSRFCPQDLVFFLYLISCQTVYTVCGEMMVNCIVTLTHHLTGLNYSLFCRNLIKDTWGQIPFSKTRAFFRQMQAVSRSTRSFPLAFIWTHLTNQMKHHTCDPYRTRRFICNLQVTVIRAPFANLCVSSALVKTGPGGLTCC